MSPWLLNTNSESQLTEITQLFSGQTLRLVDPPLDTLPEESLPRVPPAKTREWQVTGGSAEMEPNPDRQAADELLKLVQQLNRTMEDAKRKGLIVEPKVSTAKSQFGGEDSAGHIVSIKVFRKLC